MNLSIRQIRYICEAARCGSIQGASRVLGISQSSIVAAVDAAEHEMGTKLFDRRPAVGIATTPAGRRFLSAAWQLLSAEGEFSRSVKQAVGSLPPRINIGCFEPFGAMFMTTVMRRYIDEVGHAEVSLLEGDHTQLSTWLATGTVDLAVAYDIGPSLGQSATPICRIPAHAVLPHSDPLANRASLSLAELAPRKLVLLDLPHTGSYLLTLFDILAVRPELSLRSRSYETVRCAVAAGFGFSILNMRPLNQGGYDTPGIARVPLNDDLPAPTLQVVDVYGAQKPLPVRRFIEVIAKFFTDLGPARFAVAMPERRAELLLAPG